MLDILIEAVRGRRFFVSLPAVSIALESVRGIVQGDWSVFSIFEAAGTVKRRPLYAVRIGNLKISLLPRVRAVLERGAMQSLVKISALSIAAPS